MRHILLAGLFVLMVNTIFAKSDKMFFLENVGQLADQYRKPRPGLDFSLQGNGVNAFIGAGRIEYVFSKVLPDTSIDQRDMLTNIQAHDIATAATIETYRIDVELIGANKNVEPIKQGQLKYYERYYYPQFGEAGAIANSYSKIVYPNVYPHIDWVIYINGGQMEYDFVVKEGGDLTDIQIRYNGTTTLNIDAKGNLIAGSPMGTITEHAPISYQSDGKKVVTSFQLLNSVVSYKVASYTGTLLIDPYVEWATFYGGLGEDAGYGVAEDASGNVYMGGATYSSGQVATIGAYDNTYSDSLDAFLVKFDGDGTRLWATYYGGISLDMFLKIAYDNHGGIVACGTTNNTIGIATIGSDQPNFSGPYNWGNIWGGGGDAFIVKFDSTGSRIWGTYFGGSSSDGPRHITCDANGNIYMCGGANSPTDVATPGAHQTGLGGSTDAFLAKYSNSGQKLWCTYYGGNASDHADGIALAPDNTIYICGHAKSNNNIGTAGTFQPTKPLNDAAFIASFDANGTRLWGTYFGGSGTGGSTYLKSICVNANNDVFAAGLTWDTAGIITTPGCHQSIFGGRAQWGYGDVLITKFNNTGNRIWSTYMGGSGDELATRVLINNFGEIYITGETTSPNNIAINAIQPTYGGGMWGYQGIDGLVAKFGDAGNCIWSTYLGGEMADWFRDATLGSDNYLYVCGWGRSFPTTNGAHKVNNSEVDGYLVKFKDFPTAIQSAQKTQSRIELYPNPNNGKFTLSVNLSASDAQVTITICNITGQQVYTNTFQSTGNRVLKQIELGNSLPQGMYMLTLVSGNQSITNRFIKK